MASGMQFVPPGTPGRVWEELRPWLAKLALHAAPKWVPRLSFGFPCKIPVYVEGTPIGPCRRVAVGVCEVCSAPCCLDHSRIDQYGDAICYLCIAEAIRTRRVVGPRPGHAAPPGKPPPAAEEQRWARKLLDVTEDTPWEEVRSAHRKLSAKWHPDVHRGEKAKARAEAKFKDVQRALDVLSRARAAQEAA
jgi:hypothetical protein